MRIEDWQDRYLAAAKLLAGGQNLELPTEAFGIAYHKTRQGWVTLQMSTSVPGRLNVGYNDADQRQVLGLLESQGPFLGVEVCRSKKQTR